jgi:hypothetical protein
MHAPRTPSRLSSWSTVLPFRNRHARTSPRSQSPVVRPLHCPREPVAVAAPAAGQPPNQRAHSCGILGSWMPTTQRRPPGPPASPCSADRSQSQPSPGALPRPSLARSWLSTVGTTPRSQTKILPSCRRHFSLPFTVPPTACVNLLAVTYTCTCSCSLPRERPNLSISSNKWTLIPPLCRDSVERHPKS